MLLFYCTKNIIIFAVVCLKSAQLLIVVVLLPLFAVVSMDTYVNGPETNCLHRTITYRTDT